MKRGGLGAALVGVVAALGLLAVFASLALLLVLVANHAEGTEHLTLGSRVAFSGLAFGLALFVNAMCCLPIFRAPTLFTKAVATAILWFVLGLPVLLATGAFGIGVWFAP